MKYEHVAEASPTYLKDRHSRESGNLVSLGLKQTEVGVIPEDWHTPKLGEICLLINGRGFKPYEWSTEGLPIIRIQNLNGSDEFNYFNGHYDPKIFVKSGQLLFAWSGSRGTSFGPHIWRAGDALLNYHTWKLVIKNDGADEGYFFHILKQLTKHIEESAHGASALVHTQKGEMENFYLPLPSNREEQAAIANALSDVDALVNELEKLVVKKQSIKTATMQQLLTGHTRLPQFALRDDGSPRGYKQSELGKIPEDWDVLDFGYLLLVTASRKSVKSTSLVTFVGMQDVTEQAQLSRQNLVFMDNLKSGFTYFERGDVLIAKITPCFENGKGCHTDSLKTEIGFGSTEFYVLRANDESDSRFIYYWSNRESFRRDLESEMVGSAGHRRVPLSAIENYRIPVPSKEEQSAIGSILSDMDDEIQALEQRLNKTRHIKQGMMQELLTGKTRLI